MQDILSMKHGLNDKRLVDICGIQYGCPFDASLFSTSSYEGMPLIRIRDVKGGQTETYYSGEYSPEFIIRKGDYLIGMDGEFNIAPWQSEDALLNQRVCKIYTKSQDVVIRYVYRFLQKELKKIEDETPFVTVKHLSAKRLNQVYLPVPPIAEQEKIVAELDCLSGIIEKKKLQLKELDNLAQSIFYEMFSNQDGTPVKLSQACSVVSGLVNPNDKPYCNYPHIGGANIESHSGKFVNVKLAKEENLISGKYPFDDTMILYSKIRPNLNKVALPSFKGICSADMYPLIPQNEFDKVFLKYILTQKVFLDYAISHSGRANIPKINREDLLNYEFLTYPITLQQDFASKIEAIEKQKELIAQSIKETETLFNSRMDYYFN